MFAKLHNPDRFDSDEFQPLVYVAIVVFSAAQFFLYAVSIMRLGSEAMRVPIHEPHRLWNTRREVGRQLVGDSKRSWATIKGLFWDRFQSPLRHRRLSKAKEEDLGLYAPTYSFRDLIFPFRLVIDTLALITLVAGCTLFPVIVVAFICWIEWYIRNDGSTNETISQVGQWSPLVSVGVVLASSIIYQLKGHLASKDELRMEIQDTRLRLRELEGELEKKFGGENYEMTR